MKFRNALMMMVGVALLAGAKPKDGDDYEWPEGGSECPAHVRLDRSKMEDVDGRKEKTVRLRPWPNEKKKMEHSECEVSDLRIHHFLDQSAIHINSGSPDKPKVNGQVGSFTKIVLKNLDIGPVHRTIPGLHMDHIWIGPGHDEAFRPDVLMEDIFLHDGNGGVMPVLFEQGGKWGTLTIRRVAVANTRHPFMIKLKNSSFKEIVVEECPGLRITMQGVASEPVVVRVRRSEGAVISLPRDNDGEEANVTVVRE